jgi:flagellar basal-body rod protein FlgB
MSAINQFEKTIDLLQRGLDVSSLRNSVIANNLANAEVPNFKRTEVTFEAELKKALDSEKTRPALELTRTDPRHISNVVEYDYRDVEPRRVLDYTTTSKANGNNVDAEQEIMLYTQNQLLYALLAESTSFEFSQVQTALRS